MSSMSRAAPVPLSPRLVFDPDPGSATGAAGSTASADPPTGWRAVPAGLVAFYRDRLAWMSLAVTAVTLCYFGGLLMFWFHAVELGEGGPAIAWYFHWLLDSTFAFLALTPALAVIIPLAVWVSSALAGPARMRLLPWLYAFVAGGLFALVTTPGPIAHDTFVARGTWIANRATELLGDPGAPLPPVQEYTVPAELTQQLGFGIAIYLALTALSVVVVRRLVSRAARRRTARATA